MPKKTPQGVWTRGTTNGNRRGSSYARRARKQFLLDTYGDGITCLCSHCPAVLTFTTVNVDRIQPGWRGGTYRRSNIRPSCAPCGSKQGGEMGVEAKREKQQARGK